VSWKEKHNLSDKNIYNYQNFDSIANNPDIDVVYVVLPPSMHAEYTIRAAKAGKHVWSEKPMAVTEAECKSMIDACAKNKVKLAV
jgi:glucose-fructose oxidoreductase